MTPLLVAIFAFAGSLLAHFIANDLDAARKRREVRRTQIERFVELLCEDAHAMSSYQRDCLYGETKPAESVSANDRAHAIYTLYFPELFHPWTALLIARRDYEKLIGEVYLARLREARETTQPLIRIAPTKQQQDEVAGQHSTYYGANLHCMAAAAPIAQATIPGESAIVASLSRAGAHVKLRWRRLWQRNE